MHEIEEEVPGAPHSPIDSMLVAQHALSIGAVEVDADCLGDRWQALDPQRLADLIAIIAMGQAVHAAKIIKTLEISEPVVRLSALKASAKRELQITGKTEEQTRSSRWRRDGFLFEAISWIAARQAYGEDVLLNDPHLKSTTQGIDGLMIEWDASATEVTEATILEDKCSENPRAVFRDQVLPAFRDHHNNARGPELIAIAASLIVRRALDTTLAVQAAGRVLDLAYRRYRAALAVTSHDDSVDRRQAVFKGYGALAGLDPKRRIAATFVVEGELRDYFDRLAAEAIKAIDRWEDNDV